ncbi:MAG: anti-sigma-factor antagonist [Chthonomonadales bacterium]|nr:anti-sigma-factor antagonist [Chthonomonadales bacterium]
MPDTGNRLSDLLTKYEAQLLTDWIAEQTVVLADRSDLIKETELKAQGKEFMGLLRSAVRSGQLEDVQTSGWEPVRDMLASVSRARALQGFTPTETATFVFALKKPLVAHLQEEAGGDLKALAEQMWTITVLLDKLGLWTTEVYQKSREEVISRQQQELLELSTPVVKLWDGILAVPLIGTLDSARTQIVMESLLQMIVDTGSELAIIDITGVPTVDTLTAQHLLKAVSAARLMGADCIISGIRPQIAQTIVHLGVDLTTITTKATMADAFRVALQRLGLTVSRAQVKG